MRKRLLSRTLWIVVAALVIAGAGVGVAGAVIAVTAGSGDVVIGCALNSNGDLRIVSAASQCKPKEHVVELAGPQIPQTRQVDCSTGGNIQEAIDSVPVQLPLTVDITGTCTEAVRFSRDNVTLRAASPGAGLAAPAPGDSTLWLEGARHVSLEGLTLSGGGSGINAVNGASFSASGLHVTDAFDGVAAFGSSYGLLDGVTIENSGSSGLNVGSGSSISASSTTISNSQSYGVVTASGHVDLHNSTVTNSRGQGVDAEFSGSVQLYATTVEHSGQTGVIAFWGGSIFAEDGSVIEYNSNGGVGAHGGAVDIANSRVAHNEGGASTYAGGRLGLSGSTVVENNIGDGVTVAGGGVAGIGDQTIIRGNTGNGVSIADVSMADFGTVNGVQITGNGGWGVYCQSSPAVALITGNPSAVSGNTAGEDNCPRA